MSHRKANKRRSETGEDDDYWLSVTPLKKRSLQQREASEHMYNESAQFQHGVFAGDEGGSGIRRSSRTPKPKLFDGEETVVTARTRETTTSSTSGRLLKSDESPLSSTSSQRISSSNDRLISRKHEKIVGAVYDEGHKRETRRSYQDYLKQLKTGSNQVLETEDKFEIDSTKANSAKRKSKDFSGVVTPKGNTGAHKIAKEKGLSNEGRKKEIPDKGSPKVRSSSRTPIPKRVFSLIEGDGNPEVKSEIPMSFDLESEPLELTSPKARSSLRNQAQKSSLLENNAPEQKSPTLKAPKPQVIKREYSVKDVESLQNLSKTTLTPTMSDEPSPKVRVSSRGHIPKKTFSLLEGKERPGEIKGAQDDTEKAQEAEKHGPGRSVEVIVMKTETEQTSTKGQLLSSKQRFPKEQGKQTLTSDSRDADESPMLVTMECQDSSKRKSQPRNLDNTDVKIPSSSQVISERKQSDDIKEDNNERRVNKRKGKPVKRKVASTQKTSVIDAGEETVLELVTDTQLLETPKPRKTKVPSKRKLELESSEKRSVSGDEIATRIKQEPVENPNSFSFSDLLTGVGEILGVSGDLANSIPKSNKKGKAGKDESSSCKSKGKEATKSKGHSNDSISKIPEQEHIVLKLHIPHSEESTKHKKHHHHHHHHHKRKHSSNHRDGSPKKSHHKKTTPKLSESVEESNGCQSPETKKKKISIKFRGLSSKNVDLEMAPDSAGLVESVKGDDAATGVAKSKEQSVETGRAKAENPPNESVKKIKKPKPAESSSSHSESEHVKLVIKKDKLSSSNKTEEKKPVQTTSGLVKAGNQKKNTANTTASKKGKGDKTPVKSKPKVVTSYLLFCKQYRKKIVEDYPGLGKNCTLMIGTHLKDSAYYCIRAYVLHISRYSEFLSVMLTNTGTFLCSLKL
ncbi:peptidyl-prolyl cis-trans isomerase G-like [Montipora foliosa]|uniref:peptidyl-prolyl cis-trans isomerase G-like n=1 Tax=Montipora foliosa TaxID=591990 RepID=UPI0035F12600